MPSVALVIIHYKTITDTIECLESALGLSIPDGFSMRIIVVENGSCDGSWQELVKWAADKAQAPSNGLETGQLPAGAEEGFSYFSEAAEIVLLRSRENGGYAAGCNLGLNFALADPSTSHFWILNNDLTLQPDSLALLASASHLHPSAILGPTLLYADDPTIVQAAGGAIYYKWVGRSRHYCKGIPVHALPNSHPPLDYIVGAAMFFPRTVLEKIGFFNPEYFLYFEETELCLRARRLGVQMIWVPEACVIHKEGRSTGASARFRNLSDLAYRYVVRNSLLYTRQHFPKCLPTVLLFNAAECLRHLILGDLRKLRVFRKAVQEFWTISL